MNKKKTYLVIVPFFPSKGFFIGSYIFDQVKELKSQTSLSIEVVKVISLFSNEKDYIFKGIKVRVFKIIDFPWFIFPGIFNTLNKLRFHYFLKNKGIEDIDFVHAHIAYPSSYLIEDFDCKRIVQHHGLDALQLLNGRISLIKKLQKRYLIRNTIKQLNKVDLNIGVSKLVLNQLRSFVDYSPLNEYVLYNGVDKNKFYLKDRKENRKFIIGCVANFWDIKDQLTLIKSVKTLKEEGLDILLRLVGTGSTLKECKLYVNKNRLSEIVVFEKEIEHIELNDFYNDIDLFVLPSYYEALGCVYLESWATNTPFIGIEGQGISELIPDHEKGNLLAIKQSVDSLKEKILGEYNRRRSYPFVSKYDIKSTIKEFVDNCL